MDRRRRTATHGYDAIPRQPLCRRKTVGRRIPVRRDAGRIDLEITKALSPAAIVAEGVSALSCPGFRADCRLPTAGCRLPTARMVSRPRSQGTGPGVSLVRPGG